MDSAVLEKAIHGIRDSSVAKGKEAGQTSAPTPPNGFGSLVFNDAVQEKRLPRPAEGVVPHGLWPLATYREMLFIK